MKSLALSSAALAALLTGAQACGVPSDACTFSAGINTPQPNAVTVDPKQIYAQRVDLPMTVNGATITAAQLTHFHFYVPKTCPNTSVHFAFYSDSPVTDSTGKVIDHVPGQWLGGSLQEPGLTPQQKAAGYKDPCASADAIKFHQCGPVGVGWNEYPPYIMSKIKPVPASGTNPATFIGWLAYKIDTGEPACTQVSLGPRTIDAYQEPVTTANTYVFQQYWKNFPSTDWPNQAAIWADFAAWTQ